jgi:hypothetical protein
MSICPLAIVDEVSSGSGTPPDIKGGSEPVESAMAAAVPAGQSSSSG